MQTDLKKVLKKAARGHRQSQLLIYEEYYGYCMSVALRFSDSREDACEIIHDAFLKVFSKLDSLVKVDSFKPWLRRIVVNASIDYYRKKTNQIHHLEIVEHDTASVDEDIFNKLSAEDIYKAIGQLPTSYRIVFVLFAIEGYKHHEIAAKLNISEGTSKSNLSKARAKLKGTILQMERERRVGHG